MKGRIMAILSVVLVTVLVNGFIFMTVTRRVGNNFSSASQRKMIDVSKYLPFEEESDLAKVDSSLKFEKGDDLPVLDGAAALVPVYASVIDNCYPEGSVTYEGGEFSDDNFYGENFADDSVMQYQNTIRGFDAMVDGSVDLFFTAHPSAEQLESAAEKGVELEMVPVGLEAFVFFVNSKNPVDGLTSEEIRKIYTGEITSWNEVGGPSKLINPLVRIKGSGSQTMMEKFMGKDIVLTHNPMNILGGSIGYSFRYYLSGMVADSGVKMLAVDGVYPDADNIRKGTYPLTASFYVVYRKDNDNKNIKELVEWLLSDEGQRLIEDCGYVALPKYESPGTFQIESK